MRKKILWNPQTFFAFVLYCTKRSCSERKPQLLLFFFIEFRMYLQHAWIWNYYGILFNLGCIYNMRGYEMEMDPAGLHVKLLCIMVWNKIDEKKIFYLTVLFILNKNGWKVIETFPKTLICNPNLLNQIIHSLNYQSFKVSGCKDIEKNCVYSKCIGQFLCW